MSVNPPSLPSSATGSTKTNWLYLGLTIFFMVVVSIFVWRIIHYSRLLQAGQLPVFRDDSGQFSSSQALADLPLPTDDQYDVVTTDDPSFGPPDAKVKIVEFADFGCPYSQESSRVLRTLSTKYAEQIHYVYRDFPLDELHPGARLAAQAGECAAEQEMFWAYHDQLYANQGSFTEETLIRLAQGVGLDLQKFSTCLLGGRFTGEAMEDYQAGLEAGVRGTPTFFINGLRVNGAIPEAALEQLIIRFLNS